MGNAFRTPFSRRSERRVVDGTERSATSLLDIPDELLLKIVKEVDAVDRKRFSLTCSPVYNLIRGQQNWRLYHVLKKAEFVEIQDHDKFLMMIIKYHDKTPALMPIVVSSEPVKSPLIDKQATRMISDAPYSTMLAYIIDALSYYMVDRLVYSSPPERFRMEFVHDLWRIHPNCAFTILSDGNDELARDRFCALLGDRLNFFLTPWSPTLAPSYFLHVVEDKRKEVRYEEFEHSSLLLVTDIGSVIESCAGRDVALAGSIADIILTNSRRTLTVDAGEMRNLDGICLRSFRITRRLFSLSSFWKPSPN